MMEVHLLITVVSYTFLNTDNSTCYAIPELSDGVIGGIASAVVVAVLITVLISVYIAITCYKNRNQ